MRSVICVAVGFAIGVFSICSLYSYQFALFRLNLGVVSSGLVVCPILMCIGRWSEESGSAVVCHAVCSDRFGVATVMSGVVLLSLVFRAGKVCVPSFRITRFLLLIKS